MIPKIKDWLRPHVKLFVVVCEAVGFLFALLGLWLHGGWFINLAIMSASAGLLFVAIFGWWDRDTRPLNKTQKRDVMVDALLYG